MNKSFRFVRLMRIGVALVAVLFGIATIREGGSVLFGEGAAREAAGNYVPFILWFNFLGGFFYIAAGVAIFRTHVWARWSAIAIAGATLVFFALLGIHILAERLYEMHTVIAMALRSAIWCAIALLLNGQRMRAQMPTEVSDGQL